MQNITLKKKLVSFFIAIICLTGALFSYNKYFEKLIENTAILQIDVSNKQYIDKSFEKSLNGFLILSGIKSGLAVIEGSEVGVGFNIQLGDIVQSVYDYVDIAWKAALAGGTFLIIAKLIIQATSIVNHNFMALFFICMFFFYICTPFEKLNSLSNFFKVSAYITGTITIILYLIFPVTLKCSAFFSSKITNPMIEESQKGFENFGKKLSLENITEKIFTENKSTSTSIIDKLNVSKQYKEVQKKFKRLSKFFQREVKDIAVCTIKLIAGYLFDCIIFPMLFFIFLYGSLKLSMRILPEMILPSLYYLRAHQTKKGL